MSAATYPRVSGCRHCGLAVLRDNDGVWIHASLAYVCRDPAGGLRASYAAPDLAERTTPELPGGGRHRVGAGDDR